MKKPTNYKNPDSLTYTDFWLTNVPRRFKSTYITETGLSNFY